jgi:Spy/CpxP family protein refolding chaperone
LVLIASSSAVAQDRGGRSDRGGFGGRPGGFGGGMDKMSLLRAEPVIEELAISEDQQTKIRAVMEESRDKGREMFGNFRDLSDDQRREMRGKFEKLASETGEKVAEVLSDDQNKRLGEILIQVRGAHSLDDDAVAEQLGLSDEQRQSIDDLVQAERDEQRKQYSAMQDIPREERRAKFEELRGESEKAHSATAELLLAVLNSSQAAQFKSLGGEPFEFDREALFRGGFVGRRGEGRERGGERGGNRGEDRPNRPQPE